MDSEGQTTKAESKRDRVRRLLIEPLSAWGFRKPSNVSEEKHAKFLVDLADGLSYLGDDQLETLREFLRTKGEGKDRRGWPRMATITPLAEAIAPRPLEEIPVIASWFGSARGPQALEEGTLVAEFQFVSGLKRPPLHEGDWRRIRERAAEHDSNRRVRGDRVRRGVADQDDRQWLAWYAQLEARALALLPGAGTETDHRTTG
ncbi:hypothetical protein [Salipiger profundus]|uniref:Uncharacterized protein n=2 Tax=Roseobacteraceae TaxID=2854170 RepID=A0A1U7D531_9RHOB|nr:hypothetical protein [Salipiger profundus]APX23180.1 hypothetical protein Ga0080559_TMP2384 [Salipiger profundus]GGA13873.1 hypothetical protein GCM10011326_27470 [Salipiger profundus]SFD16519.1 hypothetical protein SAMN05444415_10819 [Salipiger profundus]